MQLEQRAKKIISKIVYATVATVDASGQPWNTPVLSAYDDQYNFYWGSHKESQHSKNITKNNKIFLVIYDSTTGAGFAEGVYIKATASEVNDPVEIKKAYDLLWARHNHQYWKLNKFTDDSPVQLYKARPEKIWINEEGRAVDTYIDVRTELNLATKQ